MRKAIIFIVVTFLLAFCVAPVYANDILPLPHAFYGDVTINDSPAPKNTTVEARGNGVITGEGNPITVNEVGKYGSPEPLGQKLIVTGDISVGTTITFYVNDVSTGQTYPFDSDETTRLDLILTALPSVATNLPTSVTTTLATLNGNLASLGTALSVDVSFEWGETIAYDNETTPEAMTATDAFSADLSNLSPGTTYYFRAKADGGVHGTSYGADRAFTTLTTPPTVTTNDATSVTTTSASLNGSLDSLGTASSVAVSFEWGETTDYGNTATVTASPLSQAGAFSASLSGLIRGTTYHFRVKADGGVHGTSYGADRAFTTLTTPPVVTIGAVTTPTNVATQTLSGTMEEGTMVALTADTAATFGEVSYTTAITWSCEVTLVEGSNEITATATDAVGNEGTATDTIVLDTATPAVEITSPLEGDLLNTLEVTIEGTATEVAEVLIDGQIAPVVDGVFSIVLTLSEGANSVTATATDAAGNVGSDTVGFIIDVTPPVVTIGAVTTPTNVATQTLSGTMEEGTTVALTADTAATFAEVSYTTAITWSCEVTLVEGSNVITATATDAVGNEGTATDTIVLDTATPAVEITSPLEGDLLNTLEVTIEGTATEVAEVLIDGQIAPVVDGVFSIVLTLSEGANSVTATATDAAGNVGDDTVGFTIDVTPPVVKIGAVPTPTNDNTPTFTGTATDTLNNIALVDYKVDGGAWTAADAVDGAFDSKSEDYTFTTAELADGVHTVYVRATDGVGNTSAEPYVSDEFVVITYQITNLAASSPTQDSIDLTWTTPAAEVNPFSYFDVRYSEATITLDNWDEATRATGEPAPAAGASQGMKIRDLDSDTTYYFAMKLVDEEGFVGLLSNIASDTTLPAAPVDEIHPAQITDLAANPGSPATTRVILRWTAPGDDEDTGTATSYEIRWSISEITDDNWDLATIIYNNIVPQAVGGSESFVVSRLTPDTTYHFAIQAKDEVGNVSLTSNSPSITTEANLPTIDDISPISGKNSQAWTLTIGGNNFVDGGTNVVRFVSDNNTFDLTNVTCSSSTQLTADVPKGAPTGSYRARVINDHGTSELSLATYEVTQAEIPMPLVTNLIPQMAASDSAVSEVQIFGEYLTGATGVSFGDTAASNVTVISDTKITVDVPGLSAGEYDVKVTTPDGTNEISGVKFMVSDPVAITEDTTEDTTTSEVVKLDTNEIPVQLTLTTDTSETATQATDADVEIEVTIPPRTKVTCEDEAYTGNINPPRVVKPDESVLTNLSDDAVVIEMGNPEKTLKFDQDFVAIVTITAPVQPVIWYYNKDNRAYELAGKTGTKDGVDYVRGGTKLGQEDSTYTMGLLLDQMSAYVAGVKPHITSAPATVTAGSAFTITGTNFHPTAAEVYFSDIAGTIVSRTSTTQIVARFPTAGSYTLKVENPDKLSDTTSITLARPAVGVGVYEPPAPPPGTTDVRGKISTAGVFRRSVTATSEDGLCTLSIPTGTVGLTEELERLTKITMLIMDEPPSPPEAAHIVGLAYDFRPDGATFEPAITLTWSYDPAEIPEDVAEEDLVIAYYDKAAGKWIELEGCVVDTENKTVTAPVEHFTTFAIIVAIPPPAPAAFSVTHLSVKPLEVEPKEAVIITVWVANTGGTEGSHTLVLKINGVKEAEKSLSIAAGKSQIVSFTIAKEDSGTYSVIVDGLSGRFTLVAPPPVIAPVPVVPPVAPPPVIAPVPEVPPAPPVVPTPLPEVIPPPAPNWPLIGGIIGGAVVVGLLIFFLVRKRRMMKGED